MNVELSYDKEFSDLLNNLKDKYGAAIFELEGIGSQLDLNNFSKEFFSTKVTADTSIDANANVGDSSVVSYSVELTKPYEKLNSLYLLWKEMRRLYHTDVANEIIEMHISGDIYIHDLHSVNKPYSYARNTPLNIKFYGEEISTTMEQLYISMMLHHDKVIKCDREYYNVTSDEIFVEDFDEISNKSIWTKVKYVIKHKRHNKLLKFTLFGNPFELMVTEDHPMILKDGSIKDAKDVTTKDLLKSWCLSRENIAKIEVVEDSVFNDYVYDITTESGTFIVDSLVVHNCFNYSTYDIMNKGLPMITKIKSVEPKYLYSFKSQLEQFVVIASNSTLGASGIADVLIVMSYYVKNILTSLEDAHFTFKNEDAVWAYVKETIASLIYTLNQPFRGGIQCFDEETDILTPNGFKKYTELSVGDLIYTWNNGVLNIQPIKKMNVANYNGNMHMYSGRDISMCVTPNHRIIHKKNNSNEYTINESTDLIGYKTPLVIPIAPTQYDANDYNISDEMLQLVTILLTDGTVKSEAGKSSRVQLFKSPNRYGTELIHELLQDCGYEYTLKQQKHGFELSKPEDYTNIFSLNVENSKDLISLVNETKSKLPDWMFKLSKRQANLVINTWAQFDGILDVNVYGRMKLQCDSYEIAEQVQHLCMIAGYGSRVTERLVGNNKTPTIYVIPYLRNCKSLKNRDIIQYNGKVWCPTTDDGVVIVRRNGATFVSGNSAFTNVSVFDKSFIEDMSAMYIFPDGSSPDAEIVKRLQDIYVDVMNETLERTAATFPVTTAACAIDDKRMFKNPDDVKHFIRQNLQFGFMNFYSGKSTTLSSCCFNGKQMAQYYKNGECTVSRFDEIVDNDDIKLYIDNEYPRATAKLVKVKMPYATHFMYNIVTASNAILDVTGDHIHYTNNGDKYTYELDIGSLLYDSKIQMFTPITSISKYISDDKYVYCFEITEPNAPPYFILYNGIITHNCRLRSDMETIGYTNSIGGSGTKIGSVSVGTVNMYRLAVRANGDVNKFIELLKHTVGAVARVNHARRTIIRKKSEKGFAPLYTHEFISLDKQFSTCGINGFYEAMCELSIDITSAAGINRAIDIIEIVNSENKKYDKTFGYSHNCEQVPAESASVKIAQKDRLLGYNKEYELYSNQFIPLTASADILERIKIQGALDSHFSGGSILHLNFDQRIDDVDKIYNILQDAVLQGVVYMAINYVLNECENGHMSVGNMDICPVCGGELCNKFSRVVGFLSNVKNWNKTRRSVDFPNRKFYKGNSL